MKLSTPGGVVEWVASDGRKGTLTGPGKARAQDISGRKPSSDKGTKVEEAPDKRGERKENKAIEMENVKGKEKANDLDDDNPDGWTAEEDKKLLDWKAENGTKAWALCAGEVGRPQHECKERWKHIQPKSGDQNVGQAQVGSQDAGQVQGSSGGGQQQQQLTKKGKKALKQQNQGQGGQNNPGNNQNKQGQNQNNKKQETSGGDDTGDLWGPMDFATAENKDADDKKDSTDNKSNSGGHGKSRDDQAKAENKNGRGGKGNIKNDDSRGKSNNNTSGGGDTGWGDSGNVSGDNNGAKGGDWNDTTWGNNNGSGRKTGAPSSKGSRSNRNNTNAWDADAGNASGDNNDNNPWGSGPSGEDTNNNTGWGNENQKPPSNKDAVLTWGDGANDAAPGQRNSGPSNMQNNGPSKVQNNHNNAGRNARPASHRAPSVTHNDRPSAHHNNRSHAPAYTELTPDDTFSADDLRMIARILQQDCKLVWDRLSWRFRDKTGRWVAADVFERKLTGQVEKEGKK
jgi:hypothetical protein